jgi:hypothetical protein
MSQAKSGNASTTKVVSRQAGRWNRARLSRLPMAHGSLPYTGRSGEAATDSDAQLGPPLPCGVSDALMRGRRSCACFGPASHHVPAGVYLSGTACQASGLCKAVGPCKPARVIKGKRERYPAIEIMSLLTSSRVRAGVIELPLDHPSNVT